ncbi:hypothetical protein PoB_003556600 [Plakobranchus ocellatus]|uniref:Uncharacterized protein n=1 Tax=Plakobranchus ocellatus TaxID=259542 RepID=A0AAV4AR74_9GAST|nr:hypothetical protein PoB_003556600 [Plakobranchus ocellatus]
MVAFAFVVVTVVIFVTAALVFVLIKKRKAKESHLIVRSTQRFGKADEPRDDNELTGGTTLHGDFYAVVNKPQKSKGRHLLLTLAVEGEDTKCVKNQQLQVKDENVDCAAVPGLDYAVH